MIAFALALLTLAIWLTLIFARGFFWQARESDEMLAPLAVNNARDPRVTAIVPARDEAETIARCVTSLLRQECAVTFDVILVDDQSSDGTGEIARRAAEALGAADRLTVLRADDPPPGWTGKTHSTIFRTRPNERFRRYVVVPAEHAWINGRRSLRELRDRLLGRS